MRAMLCKRCPAICCKYLALPLDVPERKRDFDDLRWFLLHEGTVIFVEEGTWYLQMDTRCKALTLDHRCSIYETRPRICREYTTEECEYLGGEYDYERVFTSPEELAAFANGFLASRRKRQVKGRRKRIRKGVTFWKRLRSAG